MDSNGPVPGIPSIHTKWLRYINRLAWITTPNYPYIDIGSGRDLGSLGGELAQFSNRFESHKLSNVKRPLNRAPNLSSFSPHFELKRAIVVISSTVLSSRLIVFHRSLSIRQRERGEKERETLVRKFSTQSATIRGNFSRSSPRAEQRSMSQFPGFGGFETLIGTIRPMRKDGRSMDDRAKRPLDSDARSKLESLYASPMRLQIYIDFENARLISAGIPKRRTAYSSTWSILVRRDRVVQISLHHLYGSINKFGEAYWRCSNASRYGFPRSLVKKLLILNIIERNLLILSSLRKILRDPVPVDFLHIFYDTRRWIITRIQHSNKAGDAEWKRRKLSGRDKIHRGSSVPSSFCWEEKIGRL